MLWVSWEGGRLTGEQGACNRGGSLHRSPSTFVTVLSQGKQGCQVGVRRAPCPWLAPNREAQACQQESGPHLEVPLQRLGRGSPPCVAQSAQAWTRSKGESSRATAEPVTEEAVSTSQPAKGAAFPPLLAWAQHSGPEPHAQAGQRAETALACTHPPMLPRPSWRLPRFPRGPLPSRAERVQLPLPRQTRLERGRQDKGKRSRGGPHFASCPR